jgi:spore germination protein
MEGFPMLIHVVRSGETLWSIANNYGVQISKIIDINGLNNPNQLAIGQSLIIPIIGTYHTVRAGETLWRIAQVYGTSIQRIVEINRIVNPAYIYPGLTLFIPAPQYTIQAGETLWAISQRYGVSLQSLIVANSITDPNLIYPGTVITIPPRKPTIEVNGYTYVLGNEGVPVIAEVGEYLTYLSPFAYLIREDGSLQSLQDIPLINEAYRVNAVPMMSITNFTVTSRGENLASLVLNNREIQERLLANIINIMDIKGYQGLNIDFENVLPRDREPYNQFLQLAVDRLHDSGYFVSSAVAPKISAEQAGLLYEAHDYPAHGRILDFVILMTYEWGWRKGPPQAISPLSEIKRVLDYAVTVIPRNKIFFGFQIYARDWLIPFRQGQEAETFSVQEAIERAIRYGATIQYDLKTESPFYRYTDERGRSHEVWFEDARSAQAKFNAVKDYGLRGISYWALGYPYPQNWSLLEANFNIKKIL